MVKLAIFTMNLIEKVGLLKLFAKLYCKGYSGADIVKITGVNRTTVGKQIADMKKYLQSV